MAVAAVTGASGFIGQALTQELIRNGWRVRALVRSRRAARIVSRLGAKPVPGALDNPHALDRLMTRADALVHCAGQIRGRDYADFERVNVVASAFVAEAAARAGLPTVALSSLTAREPSLSGYARSKRAMEFVFAGETALQSGALPTLILRAPAVYGPGDRELGALFDAMARGVAIVPAPRETRFSLLHVDDLAAAILAWLADGPDDNERQSGCYTLHDGHTGGYSWPDVVATAETVWARRIRQLHPPASILELAAKANVRAASRLGYAPMFTPGKLRELAHPDWVCDNEPLQSIIDWQPCVALADGLAQLRGRSQPPSQSSIDHRRNTPHGKPLSRNLRPFERAAQVLGADRRRDQARDQARGRSGPGFGAGDGSADGTRGHAGHHDSAEFPAGSRDHGRSGQGVGQEYDPGPRLTLFDKFEPIAKIRREIGATGIDPLGVPIERIISATEAMVQGQRTILAGSNNYLGLTFDSECVEAATAALREQGTGTTGSRMANGSYDGHLALEAELAAFYGVDHAIVFSTGYQANLGMLSALTGPKDVVMLDADCHASIYDGVRLGGAETLRFKHNDPADLNKRLRRLGERASNTLVVVEGIYSMLGDQAPLAELVDVVHAHGAAIFVDEAHSMGIVGRHGRGVTETAGVIDRVDFIVGTFSKSLGAAGGFCVSRHPELDMVRYASRPYIFTASPVPSVIASTRTALRRLRDDDRLRQQIWANARRLHAGLAGLGFKLGAAPGPVVAAVFADRNAALEFWQGLLDRGVYVNLMLPPATPGGQSLVRASLSAAHTPDQIDAIIAAFAATADDLVAVG